MKNLTLLPSLILFFVLAIFSSCERSYTCNCTVVDAGNGGYQTSVSMQMEADPYTFGKAQARRECEQLGRQVNTQQFRMYCSLL